MRQSMDNRKKALIVSVLLFLAAGGGIFTFFIIQGANDLTGEAKRQNFTYGSVVREAVLPLFKRMGFETYEEEVAGATKKRLEARGLDLSGLDSAPPAGDISDWMNKPSASAAGKAPASRPVSPTSVPKMGGSMGSAVGGGGGGGTKSAGSVTRFGDGSAAGATGIKPGTGGAAGGPADKGTLGALKNAKAVLGEGLRSDSAMTASAKWNQSFGLGSGSNRGGGDMNYGKTGLVNLDKIKSGEISDLKMDKMGSLKTTDVSNPLKDVGGTKAALDGDKKFKNDMENKMKQDLAKGALEGAMSGLGKGDDKGGPSAMGGEGGEGGQPADPNKPPKEIVDMAMTSQNNGGKMCPSGCDVGDGKFQDSSVSFKRDESCPNCWSVTYNGTQTMPDGSKISYQDTMILNPSTGQYTPVGSVAGPQGGTMQPVSFGGT